MLNQLNATSSDFERRQQRCAVKMIRVLDANSDKEVEGLGLFYAETSGARVYAVSNEWTSPGYLLDSEGRLVLPDKTKLPAGDYRWFEGGLFFLLGFCTLQHFLTSDNSHHSPLGLSLGCQKEAQPQTLLLSVCSGAVLLRCSKLMQPFLCTAAANKETKSWWSGWSLWSFWPSTKKDGNAQVRSERFSCARLSEQWDLSYFQAWQQQRLSFQRPNLLGDDLLCQDV